LQPGKTAPANQEIAMPSTKIHIRVLLASIALTSAMIAGASAQENEISAAPSGPVVVLGDSNASGTGVGPQEAFPEKLEQNLRSRGQAVRVINAGLPGDTFGGMLARVDFSVPQGTRLVIVQGGYNNLANRVPTDQTISDLNDILARLQGRGIKTVVCGFFDKNWDAIGRKLAATHGATFVPGSTCYDPQHVGPDGLHMSATGHEVVAKRLTGVVQPGVARHR
jgi:acyl-CoA thioesterase-1